MTLDLKKKIEELGFDLASGLRGEEYFKKMREYRQAKQDLRRIEGQRRVKPPRIVLKQLRSHTLNDEPSSVEYSTPQARSVKPRASTRAKKKGVVGK